MGKQLRMCTENYKFCIYLTVNKHCFHYRDHYANGVYSVNGAERVRSPSSIKFLVSVNAKSCGVHSNRFCCKGFKQQELLLHVTSSVG